MSQLQVTKITTVDNTTPLILATGNAGGGQIIIQSSNTDVMFSGNLHFTPFVTGDGSGLFIPTSNVANAAFNTANAAYASANNVAPQVTPAFNTANSAFNTANAAFASANNVAPQVTPSYNTANAAFNTANAAFASANNVAPQLAPAFNTANSAYNNSNAAFNAANTKFSSSGGTISGSVEITADLTVHGNTRFIDQQTLAVGDPLIYLAANNYTSDVVDIGFIANYVNTGGANVHTGLYRSSGNKEYYLFQGYDKEPAGNYIDPTGNNITAAILNSTIRTSNLILGGANAVNWITSAYAQANAGGANVGQTAPSGASSGKLWWNSDLGKLYVYYTDPANTSSWIETSPSASSIEAALITGYVNPVYNAANAAYAQVNTNATTLNAAYAQANTNATTLNSAFAKANTALQNTSGTFAGNLTFTGNVDLSLTTSALKIPVGTTDQRPVGATGMIRMNTTTGKPEWYDTGSSAWVTFDVGPSYDVSILIVAGGGGGGMHSGGGGGAGGLLYYGYESPKTPNGANVSITSGSVYTVVVGAGGAGSGGPYTSVTGNGYDGGTSSFALLTATGGGGGGSGGNNVNGRSGGSGGGGGRSNPGGSGTSGQGNSGGYLGNSNPSYPGGGGGGAAAAGTGGTNSAGGTGGNGYAYSISGSSTYYAGGGGGNLQDSTNSVPTQGAGGLGGGGAGTSSGYGTNGTTNTGGGAGGANYNTSGGGTGGSGVVIISYPGSQRGSGGTVTSSGGRTIHTFTTSGTFTA